jgi:23S rRNA pseudouridine1911/1915/1917 synthase
MTDVIDKLAICIPDELYGIRIDIVLATLIPSYSRSQLTQWLKQGKITVNKRLLKPKDKVMGGEEIKLAVDLALLTHNSYDNQPEAIALSIVYEDDHLLVVNKPAGLIVHPGAGNPNHTLVNALLYHEPCLKNLPRAGIVHRLDKDTTGLLIVAKTLVSYTNLVRQMQARLIKRCYLTLVHGHLIAGGEINTGYARHPRNRLKMAVSNGGRQAITRYTINKHYQFTTLVNVELLTGRTHQIRVHMAHINHTVVGDLLYGGRGRFPKNANDDLLTALQQFRRQALHAITLSFNHPVDNQLIRCHAPLPADFQTLINLLDNHVYTQHT